MNNILQIGSPVVVLTSDGIQRTTIIEFTQVYGVVVTPLGTRILNFDCFKDIGNFPNATFNKTEKTPVNKFHHYLEGISRSYGDICFKLKNDYTFNTDEIERFNWEIKPDATAEIPFNAHNLLYIRTKTTVTHTDDLIKKINSLFYETSILNCAFHNYHIITFLKCPSCELVNIDNFCILKQILGEDDVFCEQIHEGDLVQCTNCGHVFTVQG